MPDVLRLAVPDVLRLEVAGVTVLTEFALPSAERLTVRDAVFDTLRLAEPEVVRLELPDTLRLFEVSDTLRLAEPATLRLAAPFRADVTLRLADPAMVLSDDERLRLRSHPPFTLRLAV